jgi:hypothetical protein
MSQLSLTGHSTSVHFSFAFSRHFERYRDVMPTRRHASVVAGTIAYMSAANRKSVNCLRGVLLLVCLGVSGLAAATTAKTANNIRAAVDGRRNAAIVNGTVSGPLMRVNQLEPIARRNLPNFSMPIIVQEMWEVYKCRFRYYVYSGFLSGFLEGGRDL